ncbi:MAG: 16S rRNA (adenine(1518)-N(6)/adenine(1519)-N(6))-dimethyltransferase RsmA [Geobacteraceae bacterium]|nr:16S rRNA (adenine(1518)-N(6)/adenine(1519)-N(6))-dimethyltransferase RsmA [Geobacteraceae bacterium]
MEKIRAKKALGQNFLTDRGVLARIARLVERGPDASILEVGPGLGALTRLLAEEGARVVAVELDRQLVPLLAREFAGCGNVELVQADILKTDLAQLLLPRWPGQWQVAANLPYNISSPVLFHFMENRSLFSRLVLMLQREVGERLVAQPGTKEYGILSVLFRLHFDINREFIVKPGSFHPVPKVDSVVLSFTPLPAPRVEVGDEPFFRRVVKAAFGQRRKTLWNCLKRLGLECADRELAEALAGCWIEGTRRGETLSLEEFAVLTRALICLARGTGEAGKQGRGEAGKG